MATQVQFRRGNTAQNDAFTGAEGELTVNLSNNAVRVHDGATTGGFELLRADLTNIQGSIGAAGNVTEVQFNDTGGIFGASSGFTYDKVTTTLTTANIVLTDSVYSNLNPGANAIYELGNATNQWNSFFSNAATIGTLTVANLVIANLAATQLINGNSNVIVNPNGNVTFGANGVADLLIIDETGATFLDVANVHIPGGTPGQQLSTDGLGNLTWVSPVTVLPLANGTSNIDIPIMDGNIVFGVNNNANFAVMTDTHLFINGDLTANGNVTTLNLELSAGGQITTPAGTNGDVVINPDGIGLFIVTDITPTVLGNSVLVKGAFTANANTVTLGAVANLHIDGGTAGQLLSTDGTGNLSWSTVTGGGGLANGTTAATVPLVNGNINFDVGPNIGVFTMTPQGANVMGTVDVTGNVTAGNVVTLGNVDANNVNATNVNATTGNFTAIVKTLVVNASAQVNTADLTANGNVTLGAVANVHITGGAVGQALFTDGTGVLAWANVPAGNGYSNGTTNSTIPAASGNILFTVGGIANTVVLAPTQTNINTVLNVNGNANIVGEILGGGNANITNNVLVGGNITANGTATVVGNITGGNLTTAGTVTGLDGIFTGNVAITGNVTANNGAFASNVTAINTTLTGNINAANGNITGEMLIGGNANVTGQLNSATANVTGNVTAGNVSTGILAANIANISGNLTSGNANLGNLATANFFQGDGSLLTNVTPKGTLSISYAYSNASPLVIGNIPAGNTVTSVRLVNVTPFSDATAKLSVGDASNANLLLATTDAIPGINGTFETLPASRFGAETPIILTIVPGTSTSGDGVLQVTYQ